MKRLAVWMTVACLVCITMTVHTLDFEFKGVRTYTVFSFLPAPTGADIRLIFPGGQIAPAVPLSIAVSIGGGYEQVDIFRNNDGTNLAGGYGAACSSGLADRHVSGSGDQRSDCREGHGGTVGAVRRW